MAAEAGNGMPLAQNGTVQNGSELSGAALLVVVGEPFTSDHRDQILEGITKGFRSWDVDVSGCDINTELQAIATAAPTGEEGLNGERVIDHVSDKLHAEVLVNPQQKTLSDKLKSFLQIPVKYRHLIYSGHAFQGTGDWILQDDTYSYQKFSSTFKDADVENVLKLQRGSVFNINTFSQGDWNNNKMAKESFGKILDVNLNNDDKLTELNGAIQFTAYLTHFIKVRTPKELLRASDVVGNIRFSKPTLYIFPGGQGDSALFGISGFNLLVNAGYNRKACCWDFTRHLDRIDALLLTHLGFDNVLGASTMMERKALENVHPEIGHVYVNVSDKVKHSPNGDSTPEDGGSHKQASLLVNLIEEGNRMLDNMRRINTLPNPCATVIQSNQIQPINLYHKVGHGSLDMYVLNPQQDGKEMKDFMSQWSKHVNNFTNSKSVLKGSGREGPIPLPNMLSVCALLVWRPTSPLEQITRILFPGNTPQSKIFEGLDKLKNLDIFQHANCADRDKKTGKKAAPVGRPARPSAAKPSASPAPKAEPRKVPERRPEPKPEKVSKDVKNKKAATAVNGKKEKKVSPATTPSDTKTPTPVATPVMSATPSDTPKDLSPGPAEDVSPEVEMQPPVEDTLIDTSASLVDTAVESAQEAPLVDIAPKQEPLSDDLSLVDLSLGPPAEPEVPKELQATDMLESASMPEADQDFKAAIPPASEPLVDVKPAEDLDSPEPLPDPNQFDPNSFVNAAAAPAVSEPRQEDLGIYDVEESSPEPVAYSAVKNDLNVEPQLIDTDPVQPSMDDLADLRMPAGGPQDMEGFHDDKEAEIAPTPPEPSVPEPEIVEEKHKLEEMGIYDSAAMATDTAPHITESAAEEAAVVDKQKFEELGIYDEGDEKDVDTAEAQQPQFSQQDLADLGIYDDGEEPESEQMASQNTHDRDALRAQGVYVSDDEEEAEAEQNIDPQIDGHVQYVPVNGSATPQHESETEAGLQSPAEEPDLGHSDVGGKPEADQSPVYSDGPQGLPSPREPVYQPEPMPVADFSQLDEQKPLEEPVCQTEPADLGQFDEHKQFEDEPNLEAEDAVQSHTQPITDLADDDFYQSQQLEEQLPVKNQDEHDLYSLQQMHDFTQPDLGICSESQATEPVQTCPDQSQQPPTETIDKVDEENLIDDGLDESAAHTETALPASEEDLQLTNISQNPFDIMDSSQGFSLQPDESQQGTNPFLGIDNTESLPVDSGVVHGDLLPSENGNPFADHSLYPDPLTQHHEADTAPLHKDLAISDDSLGVTDENLDRDSLEKEQPSTQQQQFDPLSSWGEPMGLPAPPPPNDMAASSKKPAAKGARSAAAAKPGAKKPEPKKKKVPTATLR